MITGNLKALFCIVCLGSTILTGCTTTARVPKLEATSQETKAHFEALKALSGRWHSEEKAPDGSPAVVIEFRVISGGHTIVESMFPGQPHEMINAFHIVGDGIEMTHYCAAGNQPHMRLAQVEGSSYRFLSTGVSNLADPQADHMKDVRLDIKSPNEFVETWYGIHDGQLNEGPILELKRAN